MPHLVKKGFLTTCLTTDSFGTHGNSGVKMCGELRRNEQKPPEMAGNVQKKFSSTVGDFCAREANTFQKDYQKSHKTKILRTTA